MVLPRFIDLPPVWLAGCVILAWIIGAVLPLGLPLGEGIGALLVLAGIGLMVWAVVEMQRARTTVIPHRVPDALVDTGPFALSRNPIYLGDLLVLAGLCLRWDALLALPLVWGLMKVLTDRFILPEEGRLADTFGTDFQLYSARVARWI